MTSATAIELPEHLQEDDGQFFVHVQPASLATAEDFLVALFGPTYAKSPIPSDVFSMIRLWWTFSVDVRQKRQTIREEILVHCVASANLAESEAEEEDQENVDVAALMAAEEKLTALDKNEGWLNDLYLASRYHLWRWTGYAMENKEDRRMDGELSDDVGGNTDSDDEDIDYMFNRVASNESDSWNTIRRFDVEVPTPIGTSTSDSATATPAVQKPTTLIPHFPSFLDLLRVMDHAPTDDITAVELVPDLLEKMFEIAVERQRGQDVHP